MARNYTQFSELIEDLTPEETKWAETVLQFYSDKLNDDEEGRNVLATLLNRETDELKDVELYYWPSFEWSFDGNDRIELHLYSEDTFVADNLIAFIQSFIRKFRPDFIFTLSMSHTCSKPRINEFGGSWLIITKDEVLDGSTWEEMYQTTKKINKLPAIEKCTIKENDLWPRFQAVFTPEMIDDFVHEFKSTEASDINNEGLESQFDYLINAGGPDWVAQLIEEEEVTK
jgi:hypothetical protein